MDRTLGGSTRQRSLVLFAAAALLCALPSTAVQARAARADLALRDCHEQTVAVPVSRDQVAAALPAGFEAGTGYGGQEAVTNLYVTSLLCGDPASPELEMAMTYVGVSPPARYASDHGGDRYIFDIAADGPHAAAINKTLCLGGVFEEADVQVTAQRVVPEIGPHAAAVRTSIVSDDLSAEMVVTAEGSTTPMIDNARWFFGSNAGRYVDASYDLLGWGLGSGVVAFSQPYMGLTGGSPGLGIASLTDIDFVAPRGCSR